jgi:hypothetical protein
MESSSPVVVIEDPAGDEPKSQSMDERREWVRRTLAVALVAIFGLEVLGAMAALCWTSAHPQDLKDILTLILSPTVALTGSAIGFYFGRATAAPT